MIIPLSISIAIILLVLKEFHVTLYCDIPQVFPLIDSFFLFFFFKLQKDHLTSRKPGCVLFMSDSGPVPPSSRL